MSIVIPKRLEKRLKKEPIWHTNIMQLCTNTVGLYQDSPEFFPDYTIHGFGHINTVLEHADALIDQKTLRQLQPRDVAFLAAAVILHDAGMFLRRDGVQKLVTGSRRDERIEHCGDEGWGKVWDNFVDRTKRYPEEKMRYLFGQHLTVTESCISKADLSDNDKRIIGEFLRQNHGRMAHEIAVNGLPGTVDIDVFERTTFTRQDRDLIGLLARSHTMAVRDTEPYTRKVFGRGSMPYNTPGFYLMVVLRMADALDAGKHRISKFRDFQQEIRVPISVEEWTWNERIDRGICRWDMEEKTRYIYAEPTTSIEYVQLDKWLKATQAELDLCWSVLAEQYADKPYRLSIHRIQCNIHETDVQETMNSRFLTQEVKVTANPEVTRLLIAPLYGNDPSYGVRELLQNAVDACVERKHREGGAYRGLVTIRIDPWTDPETGKNLGIFTIEDNGIGMNEHVLLNYYLSAGSSYRSSDEWKRDFTVDNQSQVARTGKFGVGFLASFLLGSSISITTQHIGDTKGYTFTYTNQSKPLNIVRQEREQGTGTTITIQLKAGVWEELSAQRKKIYGSPWHNWYAFDEPKVRYYFNGEPVLYRDTCLSREKDKSYGWFSLNSNHFDTYLWKPRFDTSGRFFCNGLRIYNTGNEEKLLSYGLRAGFPDVSLIDVDAKLDVDLSRSRLQYFPEYKSLQRELCRYHIARLLMTSWDSKYAVLQNLQKGFRISETHHPSYLLTSRGFLLNNAAAMAVMKISQYMILYYDGTDPHYAISTAYQFLPENMPICVFTDGFLVGHIITSSGSGASDSRPCVSFTERVLDMHGSMLSSYTDGYTARSYLHSAWIREDVYYSLDKHPFSESSPCGAPFCTVRRCRIKSPDYFDKLRKLRADQRPIEQFIYRNHFDPKLFPIAVLVCPPKKDSHTTFASVLRSVLVPAEEYDRNDLWIPYDMEERKKKFPKAFEELSEFIDYIQSERDKMK